MALLTSNTSVDDVFATLINKQFISDLEFMLQHQKFTSKLVITKGAGANIGRFVDFAPPLQSTGYTSGGPSTITEASTTANEIVNITTTPTNVTIGEYGEFIKIGQLWEYASVEGSRERMQKRVLDGGLIAIDTVVRTQAHLSTTVLYADKTTIGGLTSIPSGYNSTFTAGAALLIDARKLLVDNKAKGFRGVPGHPEGHMAALITPKQELDVVTEVTTSRIYWSTAVVNVPGAMGQEKFVNGYIGSIYQVATYITQNYATATVSAAANDVGYVYCDGGVAAAAFEDINPRIVINEVNSPYKNVNSIAWHAYFGAGLVSSLRVCKLYSAS